MLKETEEEGDVAEGEEELLYVKIILKLANPLDYYRLFSHLKSVSSKLNLLLSNQTSI
jgi:hypothetical protein